MGHWAAAQSLRQQLLRRFPGADVTVEDFPAYVLPNASAAIYKFFDLVVTHGSHLFNTYYKLTALGHTDARPPMESLFLDKLAELLEKYRPDAVIATHPLCAQIVSRLKEVAVRMENCYLDLPLITCITDVSSHPEWINRHTDCYLVPSGEVKKGLVDHGVLATRICVTGIPVKEEFRRLAGKKADRNTENGGGTELLMMGGGLGLMPGNQSFYEALHKIPDTHITVITGHNQKLFRKLAGRWENVQVLGYVDRVWEYLEKADMIVTKPGGITLFESIYARVPIFAWPPSLCQECSNARWMIDQGIGWVAERKDCAEKIQEVLLDKMSLARAAACMENVRRQLEAEAVSRLMAVIAGSREAAA